MVNKMLSLVSVIIPVYNTGVYLESCLQSVLTQSYTHLEVIVVNDGSTDNSLSIIKKYAALDKRIKFIDKNNEGLPLARKSGLDIATGKYIQHLDSDDVLLEFAIERLVQQAEKTGADIVCAPFISSYSDKPDELFVIEGGEEFTPVGYLKNIFCEQAVWTVWSHFQKRSLYLENEIVVVPEISLGEDAILMIQLILHAEKIVSLDVPTVRYNHYPTSMSTVHQLSDQRYCEFKAYSVWIKCYLEKRGILQEFDKELAWLHVRDTFVRIYYRRLEDIKKDMQQIYDDLNRYPDLEKKMEKRKLKIIKAYHKSSILGYFCLRYYIRKRKL